METMTNAYKILVGKHKGKKRQLGRARRRWEANVIKDGPITISC
jgi:hypothetical protein